MREGSKSQRKKLEKISLEELMGAAGMCGFGALIEGLPADETARRQTWTESRLRLSLRAAAIVETLGRQNDAIRLLNDPLTARINSLERVLGMLARMKPTASGVYSGRAGAAGAEWR